MFTSADRAVPHGSENHGKSPPTPQSVPSGAVQSALPDRIAGLLAILESAVTGWVPTVQYTAALSHANAVSFTASVGDRHYGFYLWVWKH